MAMMGPAWGASDQLAFQAAERALAGGDAATAEREASALAQRHPQSAGLHRLIATARRRRGDIVGAGEAYRAAEAIAPDDPDLLVDHAGLLDRVGAHQEAVARYRRALDHAPRHPNALLGLSLALKHAGALAAAMEAATIGARLLPVDPRFWQARGAILRDLGESDLAAQAFDEVLRIAPHDAAALRARARVEAEAGRPALPYYERACRRLAGDRDLLLERAVAGAVEGRAEESIAQLDALVRQMPDWQDGHVALARLRWQYDGPERFDEGFRRTVAAAPGNGPIWAAWLRALSRAGRHEGLAEAAAQARAALGPSATIDLIEANSASAAGDIVRADALFSGLPAPSPDNAASRLPHLLRAGRHGEAAALAEAALQAGGGAAVAPYLDSAWRMLGDPRAEWLLGRPDLIAAAPLDIDLEALARQLRGLHAARHAPLDQSLHHGTQTEGPLLSRSEPIIRDLRAAVLAASQRYVAALPPVDPRHPFLSRRAEQLLVTGSWSVRLTGGGFHVSHIHSAGWISSAFYVALPDAIGSGRQGDHAGWLVLGEPPAGMGDGLEPRRLVRPRPGLLVLFPSMMWHGTRPFGAGERLTAAFDLVPRQ
jgi:tetratricopeptide (TPR) repeat protein